MGDLLHHKRHWILTKLQKPPAAHIAITDSTSAHWQDLVDSIKQCTQMMKDDKNLNKSVDTAMYGMAGMIPDKSFTRQFILHHQAAMLDTLE